MMPIHLSFLILLPLLGGVNGAVISLLLKDRRGCAGARGLTETEYMSALSRLERRAVDAARSADRGARRAAIPGRPQSFPRNRLASTAGGVVMICSLRNLSCPQCDSSRARGTGIRVSEAVTHG